MFADLSILNRSLTQLRDEGDEDAANILSGLDNNPLLTESIEDFINRCPVEEQGQNGVALMSAPSDDPQAHHVSF